MTGMGAAVAGFARAFCSSRSSCIVRFRSACGIRLMRISRRVRRPCACSAYCVRSLRARSVTVRRVSRYLSSRFLAPHQRTL
jgi:hypothetical protein